MPGCWPAVRRRWRIRPAAPRAKQRVSKRPAFAALVEFQILEALAAPGLAQAEVELAHVLVAAQLGGRALEDDAAVLHDVAVVGEAQRDLRVLLDEQERRLLLVVDLAGDVEDLALQQRRPPPRSLS